MLQINPFLDCTVYSGIVVHIGRNSQDTLKTICLQHINNQILSQFLLVPETLNK